MVLDHIASSFLVSYDVDYDAPCPFGWEHVKDECLQPVLYPGPCASRVRLGKFSDEDKQHFEKLCGVRWPKHGEAPPSGYGEEAARGREGVLPGFVGASSGKARPRDAIPEAPPRRMLDNRKFDNMDGAVRRPKNKQKEGNAHIRVTETGEVIEEPKHKNRPHMQGSNDTDDGAIDANEKKKLESEKSVSEDVTAEM
eukprot:GEMP01078158.1.p2 GENE.GEMP01078158.1~~GEMP01078158.1.p2  ORF type:complete len:197 (+),score=57.28 GEMP01078158.1:337-927(+)